MALAPEPILRAGNETVHYACVLCRLWALEGEASRELIVSLMDAIHDMPRKLVNWDGRLSDIRMHLECFNGERWGKSESLVQYFDERLKRYGYAENAV